MIFSRKKSLNRSATTVAIRLQVHAPKNKTTSTTNASKKISPLKPLNCSRNLAKGRCNLGMSFYSHYWLKYSENQRDTILIRAQYGAQLIPDELMILELMMASGQRKLFS